MALSFGKFKTIPSHHSPRQLVCLLVTAITFVFLRMPLSSALNFTLPSFSGKIETPSGTVSFSNDATVRDDSIFLTKNQKDENSNYSVGRIIYSESLHLWDNNSNELTSFYTNFSFTINSNGENNYGDGMAFFLAPIDLPPLTASGGSLGLPPPNNSFVAVEFDTFPNSVIGPPYNATDPFYNNTRDHVGIDIDSLQSKNHSKWYSGVTEGRNNTASIRYDSSSKILSVIFTNFIPNSTEMRDGNLSYLVDLRDHLPQWVSIGFSAATGLNFESHTLNSWYFTSDELIQPPVVGGPIVDPPSKRPIGLAVGLGVGGFVVFIGLIISFFVWKKNRKKRNFDNDGVVEDFDLSTEEDDFEKGTGPRKFSYNDLVRATNDFSEQEKLGEGGFGSVYRGFLNELNSYVAVKRVSSGSKQGKKEFASEVKIISRLRHRNLVQLIGWCHEKRELLLVYEFMPNGSLDSHLFKLNTLLTWDLRYKIAQGIASGLLYLQEEWEQCVLHRDVKSSNIMLDSNFNAKLGDFGLARLVDHGKGPETTILAGTLGYMAPECVITGKASKESDVYSYGVVALEIACGRKPINHKAREDQIYMIRWVWDLYGGGNLKLLEAADPRLNGDFDEQQMERLMIVGLWCVYPDSNLRPSIRQAIQVLNFESPLPNLPSKMPVPTYFPPPAPLSSFSLSFEVTGNQNQSSIYTTDFSQATSSSSGSSTSALLMHSR